MLNVSWTISFVGVIFSLWSNGLNRNPVVDCYLLGMIKKVSGKPDESDFVVGGLSKSSHRKFIASGLERIC